MSASILLRLALLIVLVSAGAAVPGLAQNATLGPVTAEARVRFTELVSIRELSDGSVLLVDQGINRVIHHDWRTDTSREVGRRGRGPGEYQFVGRLYSGGRDSTFFTDSRTGRWNLLEGARVVRTFPEHSPLNRLLGWRLSGADASGRILGVVGYRFSGPRRRTEAADSLLLLRVHWADAAMDTLARLKGTGQAGFTRIPASGGRPPAVIGGNPLDADEQALLFHDGAVAVARLDPYRVDWRLPTGRWVRGDPLPHEATPVGRELKCAAMAEYVPIIRPCDPDLLPGWPETLPPFTRALVTPVLLESPDGLLLVARTTTTDDTLRTYDLIDREGRLVSTLERPRSEYVLGFGQSAIYIVATDELDRQTLRRHLWLRP